MQSKKSKKINLIDFATFQQIQNNENNSFNGIYIRNAKYRKKHKNDENNFDLAAWINRSQRCSKARAHFKKGATLLKPTYTIRKSGKVSENKRKKLTRLKKSIMRYRILKHKNNSENEVYAAKSIAQGNTNFNNISKDEFPAIAMNHANPLISQGHSIDLNTTDYINSLNDDDDDDESKTQNVRLAVIAEKFSNLTIHSRRFREYCDNCTTQDLASLTQQLLADLNHFQRRAYAKNPVKANAHRRFVVGFREVQNHLSIRNKVKLVLIATDCEKCSEEGSIDSTIESVKAKCKSSEIPYCFSLDRRKLAYALHKKGIVSCVAILDYDGAREKFTKLIAALEEARQSYQQLQQNL